MCFLLVVELNDKLLSKLKKTEIKKTLPNKSSRKQKIKQKTLWDDFPKWREGETCLDRSTSVIK